MKRALPLLSILLSLAGSAAAEEIRGRVQLVGKAGRGPAKGSDVRQAVVWFEPAGGGGGVRAAAAPFAMTTRQKQFEPRVLAIPRGSRVRFPNEDVILHNVFSVSSGNAFDLGLYRKGPGKEQKFDQAGLVRVYCNVHHAMVAYVLVLDTPYFVRPDANGEFVLSGVPKGPGRLTVWHEQAEPSVMEIQAPAAAPLTARVEIVRPQIPPHLNKSGQSYFGSNRDRYNQP